MAVVAPAEASGRLRGRGPATAIGQAAVAAAVLYALQGIGAVLWWWVDRVRTDPDGWSSPSWHMIGTPWFDAGFWNVGVGLYFLVLAAGFGSARTISVRYAFVVATCATLVYPLPVAVAFSTGTSDPVTAYLLFVFVSFTWLANGWVAAVMAAWVARRAWLRAPAPPREPRSPEPEEDGLG